MDYDCYTIHGRSGEMDLRALIPLSNRYMNMQLQGLYRLGILLHG